MSVTLVSGLRRSGKSAIIRVMIDRLWRTEPHYIRMVRKDSGKVPPKARAVSPSQCGVSSARWLQYEGDRVFEILPEALTAIHRGDPRGCVVIEADADVNLRFAYPYDHRVFVMPVPSSLDEVFRDPKRAAEELRRVLDDTAAFAAEIFGLFTQGGPDDVEPSEERVDLTATQMRGFLYSPLGDELATRIQLQPAYHGMVESDVVIVNMAAGREMPQSQECLRRIQQFLERIRGISERPVELLICDPLAQNGRGNSKLLKSLEPMCRSGVTDI